jgi:hypothetical protein
MTRATKNLTRLPHLSPIGVLKVEGRGQAARVPQTPAAAAAHLLAPSPLPTSQPRRRCPPPGPITAAHLLVPPPLPTSGATAAAYLLVSSPLPTSRRRRRRGPPSGDTIAAHLIRAPLSRSLRRRRLCISPDWLPSSALCPTGGSAATRMLRRSMYHPR